MTATIATSKSQEREQARAFVRDRATRLDRGETDTREDVARLGTLGLIDLGFGDDPLTDMVAVIMPNALARRAAGRYRRMSAPALGEEPAPNITCRTRMPTTATKVGATAAPKDTATNPMMLPRNNRR